MNPYQLENIKSFPNQQVMEIFQSISEHLSYDKFLHRMHPEIEYDLAIVREEILSRMTQPEVITLEVKHE